MLTANMLFHDKTLAREDWTFFLTGGLAASSRLVFIVCFFQSFLRCCLLQCCLLLTMQSMQLFIFLFQKDLMFFHIFCNVSVKFSSTFQLLFSLILTINQMSHAKLIDKHEWEFLLSGGKFWKPSFNLTYTPGARFCVIKQQKYECIKWVLENNSTFCRAFYRDSLCRKIVICKT